MLKNYIKIAWRSLLRNRKVTGINITGLALGLAVFLFIMQFVAFEWGANRFHQNYGKLYRLNLSHTEGIADNYIAPGVAPILKSRFPTIKNVVRIAPGVGGGTISIADKINGSKQYREANISYVDDNIFEVFSFPVSAGSNHLAGARTLALSASTAKKYFGNGNAVGKILTIDNQFGHLLYTVSSVFKDMPLQSDIQADIVLSIKALEDAAGRNGNDWADPAGLESGFTNVYLLLNDNADPKDIATQANKLKDQLQPHNNKEKFILQPFSELHLAPNFSYSLQTFGSLVSVVAFAVVALLILVIAWVNYINLSIAQSLNRAREIGVRKVLGAGRKQLIFQFLAETVAVTFASVAVAFVLVVLFQPLFNSFIDKELSLTILNQGWFWPAVATLTLCGALLSGVYVAFLLSSADPLKTIIGKATMVTGGVSFRKGLVVFQFMISVVFIIATFVLYRQLNFMKTQDLGMQIDQRLVIVGPSVNGGKTASQSFKSQLAAMPFISKYSASNGIPGKGYNFNAEGITRLNPAPGDEKKGYSMLLIDGKYFETYGITFAGGRNFTDLEIAGGYDNSSSLIINEKAAQQLGFKKGDDAVGQKINWGKTYQIAAVVKDYHHLSLRESIQPMIFLPAVSSGFYTLKIAGGNMADNIDVFKKAYLAQFPGNPFEYFFLDTNYDEQYKSEQKLGNVFIASALIAVFIACLGLFGMASFAVQQRVKEIGIRKVLGASVTSIIKLIATDLVKLVLIAVIVASPIAAYLLDEWLQDFAYRIQLQWWLFAAAGTVAILIAIATVSVQAIKAAIANPVDSLRSE